MLSCIDAYIISLGSCSLAHCPGFKYTYIKQRNEVGHIPDMFYFVILICAFNNGTEIRMYIHAVLPSDSVRNG
jgi:hypothetical protein